MSHDPKAFDADISMGDLSLFTPLLQEDLTKLPPPFTITKPLHSLDFLEEGEDDTHDSFLAELESLVKYFEQGYNDDPNRDLSLTITSFQFIHGATQLIATIMASICTTFPLVDIPQFLRWLGPDELESLKVLAEAVGSLNKYLTDPTAQTPNSWQQCLRCLKVAHVLITEDDWWAHYTTTNQHAAIARTSILNTTIQSFLQEALLLINKECTRA
jgi:hypothetical protein